MFFPLLYDIDYNKAVMRGEKPWMKTVKQPLNY